MHADLRRLADALGIAAGYEDIWGQRHETSDAVRRALLSAMGIAVESDASIHDALVTIERDRWRQPLPPLTVVRDRRPLQLMVRVAADEKRRFELRIATEHGPQLALTPDTVTSLTSFELDGDRVNELRLQFSHVPPLGYHGIEVLTDGQSVARGRLAVAAATCYRPASVRDGHRTWGLALQLYGLRSAKNWGIGDFSDLATVVRTSGRSGAGVIGVNPLHALFPHNPRHSSPYGPSSRMFLNVLYIDVTAVMDYGECREARQQVESAEFQQRLQALRTSDQVDYQAVAQVKFQVMRALHRHFREHHLRQQTERARAFERFVDAGGESLHRQTVFEALQHQLHAGDASIWGWPVWPPEYRDPRSPAVTRFVESHRVDIEFHAYLQWQAELQLFAAAEFARAARLSLGLYADLSVSVDRGGAEVWANQDLYAIGASIGAPPDAFNPHGQDWGLPPMIPARLQQAGYAPFIDTLRANMRHAGALRIDHVMALMRQFWVPAGGSAERGTYVLYPFQDLLGLLALESHRNECLVIGEDLGTVPDEVRTALAANDVLSYRVLLFERDSTGAFRPPAAYPESALATASTHDLPTLAGWWEGHDIDLRLRCRLIASEAEHAHQRSERASDRSSLLQALRATDGMDGDDSGPVPMLAMQRFLARTPAALMVVQPEDVFGVREQANLPGTTDQHPNWQRKLHVPLEEWTADRRFRELAAAMNAERADLRSTKARIPRATYRLQLHGGFTLADATRLVPYLDALGISHIYCSPYLRARAGSRHGYDIVDHAALNPEIGTLHDFNRFVAVLRQHGMGHIADVVPNHMGVMGADNAWWMDVLENGPASRFADFFDIDWHPIDRELAGRVLLPVLGTPYGEALEGGELELRFEPERGAFAVWYHEHRFPLDPRTYPMILDEVLADAERRGPTAALALLTDALRAMPARDGGDAAARVRQQAGEQARGELAALAARESAIPGAIERVLYRLNRCADDLHTILEEQAYRLADWRVAFDEINYRCFFDIHDLAALRMEHEPAFEATHAFVLELAGSALIDGLRIDHPDGLYDPAAYFDRLQASYARRAALKVDEAARPLYIVAEKIIAPHEHLAQTWRVHGSTGYRFANAANGLLVDSSARSRIDRIWRTFVGDEADDFQTIAYQAKRAMLRGPLAAGLGVLANQALRLARSDRRTRDHTLASLRRGLEEVAACFPVYRTYVSRDGVSAQDRRYVDWAIAQARRRSRATDSSVFEFLRQLLLAEPGEASLAVELCVSFAMRFQQLTAPVAAKGIEDTAFYRFNRLASLADVGGDPDQFGMTVRALHGASGDRAAHWPATMLATSTHDNKRSEDARARVDVLSEMPAAWRLILRRWVRFNRSRKRQVEGAPAPSRNDEYLLYQTLIGTWPQGGGDHAAYRERIRSYMIKAVREAKVHTSWIAVNAAYEHAVAAFVDDILADSNALFVEDLRQQQPRFHWFGQLNSVTLAIVKLTSPGVPDLYQGNELLDFSLVDPDNRRPVDYDLRRRLLAELESLAQQPSQTIAAALPALFAAIDGRAKLWVVRCLLQSRRSHRALYRDGDYRPIGVSGARAGNVVAYARRFGNEGLLVVAGRLFSQLAVPVGQLPLGAEAWGDTALAFENASDGELVNVLTGETLQAGQPLRLADLFGRFPGAVLHFRAEAR
jgi:(1->4)-alpha-D-glucan 1-alpha-D-glucosylmutase